MSHYRHSINVIVNYVLRPRRHDVFTLEIQLNIGGAAIGGNGVLFFFKCVGTCRNLHPVNLSLKKYIYSF
jgi:hypothetical protein